LNIKLRKGLARPADEKILQGAAVGVAQRKAVVGDNQYAGTDAIIHNLHSQILINSRMPASRHSFTFFMLKSDIFRLCIKK